MGFKGIQTLTGLTDEQAHDGALFLADHAQDAEDARLLLEICGLLPYVSAKPPRTGGGR
jgi:hypothetical protein